MRIKTTKQMRLDELIKYVWENPVLEKRVFLGSDDQRVVFDNAGGFYPSGYCYDINSLFTVEVEEELTEKTELRGVTTFIEKPNGIFPAYTASASIRECLDSLTDVENEPLKIFNGITEIWSKDTGIPEEGVIEV